MVREDEMEAVLKKVIPAAGLRMKIVRMEAVKQRIIFEQAFLKSS